MKMRLRNKYSGNVVVTEIINETIYGWVSSGGFLYVNLCYEKIPNESEETTEQIIDTINKRLNNIEKLISDRYQTQLVSIGDVLVFPTKTKKKLKLCSQYLDDKRKVIFLVNLSTGTIYRGKDTTKGQFHNKDFVTDYSKLTFTIKELSDIFHCFKYNFNIIKIEKG